MPQPTKIPRAFASSGDKNSIPDSTGNIGFASWSEGFPTITSTPFAQGGVAPKRADFNGIFNALSAATVWNQQGGIFAYDNATDYEVGNIVESGGILYVCLVANGPSSTVKAPSQTAYWGQIAASGQTISRALKFSSTLEGAIQTANNSGAISIKNGVFYDGGNLYLYGRNNASNAGAFRITATNDGSTSKSLLGKPDGTLTWDGNNVITSAGGTMSGNLTINQVLSFSSSSPVVNSGGADHYLRLGNGDSSTLYANGASLYLYGSSTTGETLGGFNLQTYDGVNRATLSGRPGGTLTWNSKNVAVVDDVDTTTSGYIRFTNGLQMVWGQATIASGDDTTGVAVSYEKPFSSAPRIFTNVWFNSAYGYGMAVQATSRTTTGCQLIIGSSKGGTSQAWANGNVIYFAIGPWA